MSWITYCTYVLVRFRVVRGKNNKSLGYMLKYARGLKTSKSGRFTIVG